MWSRRQPPSKIHSKILWFGQNIVKLYRWIRWYLLGNRRIKYRYRITHPIVNWTIITPWILLVFFFWKWKSTISLIEVRWNMKLYTNSKNWIENKISRNKRNIIKSYKFMIDLIIWYYANEWNGKCLNKNTN